MDLRLHPCSVAPAEGPEKCAPPSQGASCNNAGARRGAPPGRRPACRPASSTIAAAPPPATRRPQTSGATRRCLNPGCSERIGNSRRTGSCAPARPRVRRTVPSREKPSGPRQPTPAATATAGQPGRRRGAAEAPRRTSHLLLPRGRTRGRLIICTLRQAHATLPQSWIQRENWEFETHRCRHTRAGR